MIPVANLNISLNTWQNLWDKVNELAFVISAQTVTVNSSANGALSTGNVYIAGIMAASNAAFGSLSGGNCQISNTLVITSNVAVGPSYLSVGNVSFSNTSANQIIDSFSANTYRSSKYLVQITSNVGFQTTEVLLGHDGNNVYMTEYATMQTNGSLGTLTANISAFTVNLLFTPVNPVSNVVFKRDSLSV